MIGVEIDAREIDELRKNLKTLGTDSRKVINRAINKSLPTTRTRMTREIRKEYRIKQKDVLASLDIDKSNWSTLTGSVVGAGPPGIPLYDFVIGGKKTPSTTRLKGKKTRGQYRPKVGKSVHVKISSGKKAVAGLFLAKMKSGHVGAFRRIEGKKRGEKGEIEEKFGPSPLLLLGQKKNVTKIQKFAIKVFRDNLFHETDRVLKKLGLK